MTNDKNKKLITLMILDGYGINKIEKGNAIKAAIKPNMDALLKNCPNTIIHTSGNNVGLPKGQMGNSEVGHKNIGAGRIVYQELTKITKSIIDKDFFKKQEFIDAIKNCKKNNSKLHLMGLLSDGGVHSHNTHLYALLNLAKKHGLEDVYIHCFFDGRDVSPDSALRYTKELENVIKDKKIGKIATIMGRYYAMDRDQRWERVQKAYDAMVLGKGEYANDAISAILDSYSKKVYDEFILPTIITKDDKPIALVEENDSIIFYNFRPDRAREITRTFTDIDFKGFKREKGYIKVEFVCMTEYDKTIKNTKVVYKSKKLKNTFGDYISKNGYKQLRIAETEKYAHVTFFFNGGIEKAYEGEDRVLIPSPKVATYDLKPEMSAYEITREAIKRINSKKYDVIILNFANPDMVGHTGDFKATKTAIETIDICIGEIVKAIRDQDGIILITADHGNAEQMVDYKEGGPFTAHTTLDVPLIICGIEGYKLKEGRLADIAPTMLDLMNIDKPIEMTGESLLIK